MRKNNEGIVYTNDKCIGCNKCIASCPVEDANISVIKNGRNRIEVDASRCIHCGRCIRACQHNAREFRDDTDLFFEALAKGEKISLAVSPSFYMTYNEDSYRMLGYLKSLGVDKIYDVALGGDITTWGYVNYIEKYGDKGYYSQTCPAIYNYISANRPELLERLIPIHSPLICLAIYVHKYLGDSNKIAFIGPCIAKYDEIHSSETGSNVSYNVTFEHLLKRLENVDIGAYEIEHDLSECLLGGLYPLTGGLKSNLSLYLNPDQTVISVDDFLNNDIFMELWEKCFHEEDAKPTMLELLSCDFGCVNGTALGVKHTNIPKVMKQCKRLNYELEEKRYAIGNAADRRKLLEERFKDLRLEDFIREFQDNYQQPSVVPEDIINEIFDALHKTTEKSRHIDCGSCGYDTCYEMVKAIAYGYNTKQNCVHYSKVENLRIIHTDSLTGIRNNIAFHEEVRRLLHNNPQQQYMVGVVNIRKFKVINDLLGYSTGNGVLCYIAESLDRYTKSKGICARLYADNFAICVPYRPEESSELRRHLEETCQQSELEAGLSVDVGFCLTDGKKESVNLVIDHALMATSVTSKSDKVGVAFYDKAMRLRMLRDATINAEMHGALETKQFTIYLQPQYNYATGALTGGEALVRWIHPKDGVVSPSEFIPVFEKNGFITQLDMYVWDMVCATIARWKQEGRKAVPISVNISRIDIQEMDLVKTFLDLIAKYGLLPKDLRLEVTESAYIDSHVDVLKIVAELRKYGFIVEMDDFGSGYSSLNTLKIMPVDVVKLDLKFLEGEENARGNIILKAIIDMVKALELSVIAEGVETKKQADLLYSFGCETIQGYLYSKAIPVAEFEKMM